MLDHHDKNKEVYLIYLNKYSFYNFMGVINGGDIIIFNLYI